MRLYWSFASMPELSHLTPEQRRKLLAASNIRRFFIGVLVRGIGVGLLVAAFVVNFFRNASPIVQTLLAVIAGAIALIALFQLQMICARSKMRLQIMESLRG